MLDRKEAVWFSRSRSLEDIILEGGKSMPKKDILSGKGIPEEAIAFFRSYQKNLGKEEKWSREKNGRFAQNFRYHMLEGLQKNISNLDLLVAGAILMSHESGCLELMRGGGKEDDPVAKHELSRVRERVLALSGYMSKNGAFLHIPHSTLSFKVRLRLGLSGFKFSGEGSTRPYCEYLEFFCSLPAIWEEKME